MKPCIQTCRTIKKNKSLRWSSDNHDNRTWLCCRIPDAHNRLYIWELLILKWNMFVLTFLLLLLPKKFPFAMQYLYIPKHYMTYSLILEFTYPVKSTLPQSFFTQHNLTINLGWPTLAHLGKDWTQLNLSHKPFCQIWTWSNKGRTFLVKNIRLIFESKGIKFDTGKQSSKYRYTEPGQNCHAMKYNTKHMLTWNSQ